MINRGVAFVLASAICFSALEILTQVSYRAGASIGTALAGRFAVAGPLLWLLVLAQGGRRPSPRQVATGIALGSLYAVHARLFSEALARLDAGLVDLLMFTYPAMVMLGAVALRRDSWSLKRGVALAVAGLGTGLVLAGGVGTNLDTIGVLYGFSAALVYSTYILAGAGLLKGIDPLTLIALVNTGAGVVLTADAADHGRVSSGLSIAGYLSIAAVGVISVAAMCLFLTGIGRLGPARASIVSGAQPGITPLFGLAVFGDRLGPVQIVGAGLVIGGVVILESARSSLAWLPRLERWRLRRAAVKLDAAVGETLVRQGTVADSFFVIERGRAEVWRDGHSIGDLNSGDFFGEVALIRGGVRNATVTAATQMRLLVFGRRDFERVQRALPTLTRSIERTAAARLASPTVSVARS